jgi:CheY-like chemotaxis protein
VILCVDDEDIPRTLRKTVLARQGYTVLSAVSAAEALELLDQHHVDLVLTDQMMPVLSARSWPRNCGSAGRRYPSSSSPV